MKTFKIIKNVMGENGKVFRKPIMFTDPITGKKSVSGYEDAKRGDEDTISCGSMSVNGKQTIFHFEDHKRIYRTDELFDVEFVG